MIQDSGPRQRSSDGQLLDVGYVAGLRLYSLRLTREITIALAFCLLTVLMTWPWVLHLRDAVADRDGFNFWLREMEKHHEIGKIAGAFQNSIEFHSIRER